MAMLQEKGAGRFLMDDINAYSDAQVGAAARVVCRMHCVLQEHFRVIRYGRSKRDRRCRFPPGIPPRYRLVGKVTGAEPFSGGACPPRAGGRIRLKLPELLRRAADRLPAIAPAEVEVK